MLKKTFREKLVALVLNEKVQVSRFVEEAIDRLVETVKEAGDGTEARVEALVEALERRDQALIRAGRGTLQYAVDDLIYDHCGTSKRWSAVNNGGYSEQMLALVNALGLEEAGRLIRALIQ